MITLLAFPILHFLVFWVSVNFESILMAFRMEMDGSYYFTFAHFSRLFKEFSVEGSNMLKYLGNTLLFFPAGTMVGLPLSLIFSYFLFKKIRFSAFFRVVFFLPSIISAVALTMLFKYLVASNGPVNSFIKLLGGQKIDFLGDPRYSIYTILFYSVWVSFGYNIVLLVIFDEPYSGIDHGSPANRRCGLGNGTFQIYYSARLAYGFHADNFGNREFVYRDRSRIAFDGRQ